MSIETKRASIIEFEIPKLIPNNPDRRLSIIRGRRGTLVNIQRSRGSIWSMQNPGKKTLLSLPIQYENTYRIMPENHEKFTMKTIRQIIQDVLSDCLSGVKYDSKVVPELSKLIADRIKRLVRDLCYNRFKLVCIVFIGDKSGANVCIASRCLWNSENGDNVAQASFDGGSIFAIGTVFGLYFE